MPQTLNRFREWVQLHANELVALLLVMLVALNLLFAPFANPSRTAAPWAHRLGIIGSVMMCLSFVYSLKKRTKLLPYGRTKTWLEWHVVLGLGGAVLVELHSGAAFFGIAGLTRIVMWFVVLSGLAGRYVYNLVPQAIRQEATTAQALADAEKNLDQEIQQLELEHTQAVTLTQNTGLLTAFAAHRPAHANANAFGSWNAFRDMLRFNANYLGELRATRREIKRRYHAEQGILRRLYRRLSARIDLEERTAALLVSDEALRIWRLLHIPPCILLVALALVHVWTVFYY